MRSALKSITSSYPASARVVDGKLILSLPGAVSPIVWQMDFGDIKASALEVREDKIADTHTLVLKTPKGGVTDIAVFEKREQAVAGLMAAARALEDAHGKIRGNGAFASVQAQPVSAAPRAKGGSRWTMPLAVLLLLILAGIWGAVSMRTGGPGALPVPDAPAASGESPTGVPLSADDFLRDN